MTESRIYLDEVIKVATIPQMFNEKCTSANVEYKKYLGKIKKFSVKARGNPVKVSFFENCSNVNYILLADGISYNEDLIETSDDFCIFFQSPNANTILEIVTWK